MIKNNFHNVKSIAVVRTDSIGDMVLTLPLCRAIRQYKSDILITVIAKSYTAELLEDNRYVDQALYIDKHQNGIDQIFKEHKFDAVFFPRPVFEEIFAAYRAKIPFRIGSAFRWYSFLLNHKVQDHRKKGNLHEAEYNVRLLSSIADTNFDVELVKPSVKPEDAKNNSEVLNVKGFDKSKGYIILHPGSKGSSRDWKATNFGELSKRIAEDSDIQVVITGIESERYQCQEVVKCNRKANNLCGKLTISQMLALIDDSSLLISNSTGVIHLAAALNTPVIGIYPNTSHLSARRWGPLTEKKIILSPDINNKDIDDVNTITVEEVYRSLKIMLEKFPK